jgi:hypothetical protein
MKHASLGLVVALVTAGSFASHCGNGDSSTFNDSGLKDGTTGMDSPFGNPDTGPTVWSDFPTTPIIDPSLPSDIAMQFGAPDSGGMGSAPCIAEPAADAMIPKNWTPLFLEYASAGANVFEIRITMDDETGAAVIYTPNLTYTLDQTLWKSVAVHGAGHDLNVAVRAGTLTSKKLTMGPTPEAISTVHIAPVDAPGSVVYWSSTSGTALKGFTVGDLVSKTVLTPATASPASAGDGTTNCVSCHTSTPDGTYVVFTRDASNGSRAIDVRTVVSASAPPAADFSANALALLGRDHQGAPIMNANHYSASDAIAISIMYNPTVTGSPNYQMVWTDLHATSGGFGVMARTGDANTGIATPAWRHDGTAVAYTSSSSAGEAVISNGPVMDIYTVPYANHVGGAAKPFPGASDANYHEYYPVYSPNDTLMAFNRTDNTSATSSYNVPPAEVFIVPGNGGSAQRLRANDPPTCTTLKSPGLTNSWPRWAPQSQSQNGLNYYWIVFSSKRRPATGLTPQLYIAAVVTKTTGSTETVYADYPAIYVLAQDPANSNHIPAWDNFNVQGIPK